MDRRAWGFFGLFVGIYLLTLRGHLGSRDEEALYMTTVMLAKRAEAALGLAWTLPEPGDVRTPLYSSYEWGQPLLAIPLYLLGDLVARPFPLMEHTYVTRLVLTLFGVLVTAATVARLYAWGRLLGYSPRAAGLTAAAYGLGTLAWPYSRTFFRDPLAGFAILSAAVAVARWRAAGAGWSTRWELAAAGGWLLVATATKFTSLLALPVLAAYAFAGPLARLRAMGGWRTLPAGAWLAGAGLLALVLAAAGLGIAAKWQEMRGHYYTVLYALEGRGDMAYVGRAFYGLTVSPGKGLLAFAPPVLAGIAGLPLLARGRRPEAAVCGALPALYLLLYSFDKGWHGGACWGPRYLLPVLPLLLLPLGAAAAALWAARDRAVGRVGLLALGIVLGVGGVVQAAGLAVDPIHYYIDTLSRHALTLDSGPNYLQEVHFDPALSPIPGHLALAARDLGTLAAGRTNFFPVPYEPVSYWQYFQYLAAPDLAAVHWAGWAGTGGWRAAVNLHEGTPVVADPAAAGGAAVQAPPAAPTLLIATPPDAFPGGHYRLALRLRAAPGAGAVPVARLAVRGAQALLAVQEIGAADLPPGDAYGLVAVPLTLDFTHPVSFEVRATGATTVTLDLLRLTAAP